MELKKALLFALAALSAAQAIPVTAQMRVVGQRPVDPRLRNQPQAGDLTNAAPAGVPGVPKAPVKTAKTDTAAAPTTPPPQRAQGPLQRPTYLQGQEGAGPASGPSSIDLMKQCFDGSISGSIVNPTCVGYMAGAIGAIRMATQASDTFPICLPDSGITNESMVGEMSAYLEANGEALQKSARSVLFLVLAQRYPCEKPAK
jgi:hypothetical protein